MKRGAYSQEKTRDSEELQQKQEKLLSYFASRRRNGHFSHPSVQFNETHFHRKPGA